MNIEDYLMEIAEKKVQEHKEELQKRNDQFTEELQERYYEIRASYPQPNPEALEFWATKRMSQEKDFRAILSKYKKSLVQETQQQVALWFLVVEDSDSKAIVKRSAISYHHQQQYDRPYPKISF